MQIENHKEEVPFSYYEELYKKLDPADAAARLKDVQWDGNAFTVGLLNRKFEISWPVYEIRATDGGAIPPLPTQTFLLRYLLESKDVAWRGDWKTFREMPWGEMYNTPYTGRVLTRAAFTFGFKLAKFAAACEKLGGRKGDLYVTASVEIPKKLTEKQKIGSTLKAVAVFSTHGNKVVYVIASVP